eukprot:scaffold132110_cov51-Phaeocystis_antarctica.AAC.2
MKKVRSLAKCTCVARRPARGLGVRWPSVSEAVLRTEGEGGHVLELASRLGALGADGVPARVDERPRRVHAQVGVVEVPAHVVGKLG